MGIFETIFRKPRSDIQAAHNNANMLAMGGRVVGPGLALDIVDAYLDTEFEGGRHQTRVDMLMDIEKKYTK